MRRPHGLGAVIVMVLGCGDDGGGTSESSDETSTLAGDGDDNGEPGDGDGDGDPGDGDGDGDPGDGDGEPGDGDGDPGDGDGDGSGDGDGEPGVCDPAAFLGSGIAEDGWGVGDFCDAVYVCTQSAAILELFWVDCSAERPGCAPDEYNCQFDHAGEVSQETHDNACEALELSDIDEVWCVVWGP